MDTTQISTKPTYLICEKSKGAIYLYMEDELRYAENEPKRFEIMAHRLDINLLDLECDLNAYAENVYFVFRLDKGHAAFPAPDSQ